MVTLLTKCEEPAQEERKYDQQGRRYVHLPDVPDDGLVVHGLGDVEVCTEEGVIHGTESQEEETEEESEGPGQLEEDVVKAPY